MCALRDRRLRTHQGSPDTPTSLSSQITGVVTATGLIFGPPHTATRWGNSPCPVLPRQYVREYGDLELPFALVPGLTLRVDQLGTHFWTVSRYNELSIAARNELFTWISPFPLPDGLPGIPGGLPRSWLMRLPLSPDTLAHIQLLAPQRGMSDISPNDLYNVHGFDTAAIIELRCVMETTERTDLEHSFPIDDIAYRARVPHVDSGRTNPVDLTRHIWNPIQKYATWAVQETSARTLGHAIATTYSLGYPVGEWESLASLPLKRLADPSIQHFTTIIDDWTTQLDTRDFHIFSQRILPARAQRLTLEAIGQDLGYTHERIRQLEKIIRKRLSDFIGSDPASPLRWRIESINHQLGVAAPIGAAHYYTLNSHGRPSKYHHLILDLAGPYVESNGWLIRKSAVAGDPTSRIRELTDEYGRINMALASASLTLWGLEESCHNSFLTRDKYIRSFHDHLVRWDGPITNKLALVLDHIRKPATAEHLLDLVEQNRNIRSVKNALSADPRFTRTSLTEWGLAVWGLDEYSGIVSVIARTISTTDRPSYVDDIVLEISRQFKVSQSSVRSYCGAAMFVIEDGYIRVRRNNEPFQYPDVDLSTAKGVFRLDDGRLSLLYKVDVDVLRGSGRPIGMVVGKLLKVSVNERLVLRGPEDTSTVITFPGSAFHGPSLGSTRGLAELVGAVEGDMLTVIIDRLDESVDVRATDVSAHRRGWSLIARLTGIDEESGISGLARALRCSPGEVRTTLRSRSDDIVLDAMPPRRLSSDLDRALAELGTEVQRGTT